MLENLIHFIEPSLIHFLELIGTLILTITAVQSLILYLKNNFDADKHNVKIKFAQGIALALEFKMAAEILRTVIVKDMSEMHLLGAIIVLRVIFTFVIHWEMKSEASQVDV
jgi:uncharacterized membrane protein